MNFPRATGRFWRNLGFGPSESPVISAAKVSPNHLPSRKTTSEPLCQLGCETHRLGVWPGSSSEHGGWDGPPDRALEGCRVCFAFILC